MLDHETVSGGRHAEKNTIGDRRGNFEEREKKKGCNGKYTKNLNKDHESVINHRRYRNQLSTWLTGDAI